MNNQFCRKICRHHVEEVQISLLYNCCDVASNKLFTDMYSRKRRETSRKREVHSDNGLNYNEPERKKKLFTSDNVLYTTTM